MPGSWSSRWEIPSVCRRPSPKASLVPAKGCLPAKRTKNFSRLMLRSIPATPEALWSTSAARLSASTTSFSRNRGAARASALPSRRTRSAAWWTTFCVQVARRVPCLAWSCAPWTTFQLRASVWPTRAAHWSMRWVRIRRRPRQVSGRATSSSSSTVVRSATSGNCGGGWHNRRSASRWMSNCCATVKWFLCRSAWPRNRVRDARRCPLHRPEAWCRSRFLRSHLPRPVKAHWPEWP